MILVTFLKIELIDTAAERYSAMVMLQAKWREPKLDNKVCVDSHYCAWLPAKNRNAMHYMQVRAVYATVSTCLSVRLIHSWTVPKRLNIQSNFISNSSF